METEGGARIFGVVVALAVAVSAAIGLAAGDWSSFDWTAAVGAATAYGTLALALVTWRLAASSRQDVGQTQRLAQLAEREQQALVRPFVRPWVDAEWVRSGATANGLPLRNDGAGVALNVELHVQNNSGDMSFSVTSLGPSETRILAARSRVPNWSEVWGYIYYDDLLGRRWETRFEVDQGPSSGLFEMRVCVYGAKDLVPQNAYPKGWELADGLPRLYLPG